MKKILIMITLMFFGISCFSSQKEEIKEKAVAEVTDLSASNISYITEENYEEVMNENKGKKTLIIGATWCPHCQSKFNELKNSNVDDVMIVLIPFIPTEDGLSDYLEETKEYVKNNIPFKVYIDKDNYIAKKYKVDSIPFEISL